MGKVNSPSPDIKLGGVRQGGTRFSAVSPTKAKQPVKH